MSENPFLAGIERQGELRGMHKSILGALEENFGAVPEEVQQRVRKITDEVRLQGLVRKAVLSESLDSFVEKMDPAATS